MPATPRRNLGATVLKRRKRAVDPMQVYDQLPTPLRSWLAKAALPWSPRSAYRAYAKALTHTGTPHAALARLDSIQQRQIARDAQHVWGQAHPSADLADQHHT